jgi:hypothetical protein
MKPRITSLLFAALLGITVAADARAQSATFTYQGRLVTNGVPASGTYDLRFSIRATASGANPLGNPVTLSSVGITNGLFTVPLQFDPAVFSGEERWLAIEVRPSGTGAFTSLSPLQPITSAPYAVTALNALTAQYVPGFNRFSLDASDGSIINAVFVDGAGEVGIGTTEPAARLHIVSPADAPVPPRLQSTSSTRFNAGWDFYHGGVGRGYVGVPDAGAAFAPGEIILFGGAGTKASLWAGQLRALTADTGGNIGIGTAAPAAKLDVRGDIRLGPGGEFRAASGEENLRIVRGRIGKAGNILSGSGFQVSHNSGERYLVTFNTPFAGTPVVTCVADYSGAIAGITMVDAVSAGSVQFVIFSRDSSGFKDEDFHFIAIGPR